MATKQWRRCWVLALLLALLFGLLFLPFAKGSVDRSLVGEARAALTDAKVSGVTASSDWARITLTGPAGTRDAALAAAEGIRHRSAVDDVTYVAAAGASPDVAPVTVRATVEAAGDGGRIALVGEVATAAQRTALAEAATQAVGAAGVDNRLTVSGRKTAAGVDRAVAGFVGLLGPFSAGVSTGSASLADTDLTISGTAKGQPAADAIAGALDGARTAGVTVTGAVTVPAGPEPASVRDALAAVPGIRTIRFGTASARIEPRSRVILGRVATVLTGAPGAQVVISGHTDNQGAPADNLRLSRQRASAVRAYLVARGVAPGSLTAVGYGSTKPIASNATPTGRVANRRIDFTLQGS